KGYLLLNVQLPDSASVERTQRIMARIEDIARDTPGVEHTVGVAGQSLILSANAPNLASMYVLLKPFDERTSADRNADAIAAKIKERCRKEVRGAVVSAFGRRPSTAWAQPAVSRSSSRTGATSAWTSWSGSAPRS